MAKRLFAKIDLDLPDHPKIMPLSDAAFRAYVESILWSRKQLTDGFLASRYVLARWSLEVARELLASDDVAPLWTEVEGGYQIRNFDQHQETKEQIEKRSKQAVIAGRKGGLAKAKRTAKQTASKPLSKPLSKSLPETETETELKLKQKFNAWYQHYPKKVGKPSAERAFKTAITKVDLEELISATKSYASSVKGTDPKYIKNPGPWLNDERWNDTLNQPKQFDPWENFV